MNEPRAERLQMSVDQFLGWAEAQEERYELIEGEVIMQAGATRGHERVAKRIFALLYAAADESRFDVNKGDFGVRIKPGSGKGTILYPDVVVDLQSGRGDEKATATAIVVIEVLSEGTDYQHHVRTLESYKRLATLKQYVVFDQKQPRAWVWSRTDGGWPATPSLVDGIVGSVSIPPVGVTLRLADIYRSA